MERLALCQNDHVRVTAMIARRVLWWYWGLPGAFFSGEKIGGEGGGVGLVLKGFGSLVFSVAFTFHFLFVGGWLVGMGMGTGTGRVRSAKCLW